jgi:hypothetical protein
MHRHIQLKSRRILKDREAAALFIESIEEVFLPRRRDMVSIAEETNHDRIMDVLTPGSCVHLLNSQAPKVPAIAVGCKPSPPNCVALKLRSLLQHNKENKPTIVAGNSRKEAKNPTIPPAFESIRTT